MSGVSKKLMGTTAAGGGFTAIEDVFSTYLYTGTGAAQTITNGIDLATEGGLVWIKDRVGAFSHNLADTERGANNYLFTDGTQAQFDAGTARISSFNSDGFSLGSGSNGTNASGNGHASWTFRKAPRFFDVVTWTGDGTNNRSIAHNLGVSPGTIITKATNVARSWLTWHRSLAVDNYLTLNTTNAVSSFSNTFGAPSDSDFIVGSGGTNISGETYVAYLYAHDPLGPSGDGSDGLIACGSYTGNGSATGPIVDLGWEPQWLLVKRSNSTGDWNLIDNMRGFTAGGADAELNPNLSAAESTGTFVSPTATGFQPNTTDAGYNASGGNYIYIAIRRGPMRAPESGTEVFALDTQNSGSYSSSPYYRSGFVTDAALRLYRTGGSSAYQWFASRMTGGNNLVTSSTAAEVTNASTNDWDYMNGWGGSGASGSTTVVVSPMFRRAPEFFDVVAYTGTGSPLTLNHNLSVAPELVLYKCRNAAEFWVAQSSSLTSVTNSYILLNSSGAQATAGSAVFRTPDETTFGLDGGVTGANTSGNTYIAYLFATLAGVSKVGSYTGNGTSQTINCGFTTGARFILIKRTDSTGDWYVWDTARGIVAANDPHLSLNTTAAEVTTDDSVDPVSSGFIVNQVAATNINVSAASYIFYAVA